MAKHAKKRASPVRAKKKKPALKRAKPASGRKQILRKTTSRLAFTAGVYNRAAALAYARAYWTKATSDGYIGSKKDKYYAVDKGTVFVRQIENGLFKDESAQLPNGTSYSSDVLDDCAHFLSCCIGNPPGGTGGGLTIAHDFPTGPYGILGADRLFTFLDKKGYLQLVGVKTTDETLLDQLEAGDLIFYWDGRRYHHAAMYMADAKQRISCHTYCRSDQVDTFAQGWNTVLDTTSYTFAKVIA